MKTSGIISSFLATDLSRHSVTPQNDRPGTPEKQTTTGPMDLSIVKKEPVATPKTTNLNESSSPNSQPVDLTTGPKHAQTPASENSAVDLSGAMNGQSESSTNKIQDDVDQDKLEASRSLLRAALQAKQDAKSQHPKLLQLLGDSGHSAGTGGGSNKPPPLENLVNQGELRAPFSPLLMAAQMNLAFQPANLATGGLPQFPGASPLFGSPFSPFPSLKRKMSDPVGQLSPLSGDEKPPKQPSKRRKSMNHHQPQHHHGYDSDGSKSPSQHSDSGVSSAASLDAQFPSRVEGKRHICCLCSASFTFQTNLTRHQRKLHGKPYVRKPVSSSLGTLTPTTTTTTNGVESSTTPTSSPQPPMTYEVPPTPPIFGPVLGINSE